MMRLRLLGAALAASFLCGVGTEPASAQRVSWMTGVVSPGTPAKYNKVGTIRVGPARARNVLVLEPGTSAGAAYFVPLAKWIVARRPGWQVWAVERRENLLEDQSELNLAKRGRATATQLFNYYLGYLAGAKVKRHFQPLDNAKLGFAKRWGMSVAVQDLHRVISAAHKRGGKVVLGGHSLGGSVVTAYATWNFRGRPGANGLAGLIYVDGGSGPAESSVDAQKALTDLNAPTASPWLTFGGIAAPFAGLFNATGSEGALIAPNARSLGQTFRFLPPELKPKVPVTNLGQYGYALNAGTSPDALVAAQAHLGRGLSRRGPIHGWDGRGALTPITRFATMFAGAGIRSADGTEWYFPQRLTDDTRAVGNGLANSAQRVLDVHSTLGRRLSHRLRIYAFGAALGGQRVLYGATLLARQSHIPRRNLVLINRQRTYAHNDPSGAFPHNAFVDHLLPFLRAVAGR